MIVSKNRNGIVPDERGKTGRAKHAQVVSRILSWRGTGIVPAFGESERCRRRFVWGRAGGDRLGGTGFADRSFRDGHKQLERQ